MLLELRQLPISYQDHHTHFTPENQCSEWDMAAAAVLGSSTNAGNRRQRERAHSLGTHTRTHHTQKHIAYDRSMRGVYDLSRYELTACSALFPPLQAGGGAPSIAHNGSGYSASGSWAQVQQYKRVLEYVPRYGIR